MTRTAATSTSGNRTTTPPVVGRPVQPNRAAALSPGRHSNICKPKRAPPILAGPASWSYLAQQAVSKLRRASIHLVPTLEELRYCSKTRAEELLLRARGGLWSYNCGGNFSKI